MHLNYQTFEINKAVSAVFTEAESPKIFNTEDTIPMEIIKGYRGYVPYGANNDTPALMLDKIRNSEVMSSNMFSNILSCYGDGFNYRNIDGSEVVSTDVLQFFRRNNQTKYLLEQITDVKHFYYSICLLILSNDGKKIVRLKHKEAEHARFEVNNPATGKIENVFFANWDDNPSASSTQAYPVLDQNDPYWDLMVRLGIEPDPTTGKKRTGKKKTIFAIVTRIPTPGHKYYPFPYYASHFNSGWYDISAMIPLAKKAKMTNGMSIKYHVEFYKDYFETLFKDESITDPKKKKIRKELEFNNIKEFLSGVENSGKIWFSGYYIDPNGKEINMVKITTVDKSKDGGDYIEDAEEASNVQCYAQGVHPSLIGATPGKAKGSFSGSDKRELFTMKQSMEKVFRDLLLIPFKVIQEFNKWPAEIVFEIPHLMLTTLDTGKDAVKVTEETINTEKEESDDR